MAGAMSKSWREVFFRDEVIDSWCARTRICFHEPDSCPRDEGWRGRLEYVVLRHSVDCAPLVLTDAESALEVSVWRVVVRDIVRSCCVRAVSDDPDAVFGASSTMLCRLPFSMEMMSLPKILHVVQGRLQPLLPLLRGTTGATESSLTCDAESDEGGVVLEFGEAVGVSVMRDSRAFLGPQRAHPFPHGRAVGAWADGVVVGLASASTASFEATSSTFSSSKKEKEGLRRVPTSRSPTPAEDPAAASYALVSRELVSLARSKGNLSAFFSRRDMSSGATSSDGVLR
ncbi:hypothetical protein B0H14DRAFT_2556000 [Mycena olivaceomarginata]|nr:hypothetical protein B0H14DRAFT_2556000 [Mycena olivaceomarginata]